MVTGASQGLGLALADAPRPTRVGRWSSTPAVPTRLEARSQSSRRRITTLIAIAGDVTDPAHRTRAARAAGVLARSICSSTTRARWARVRCPLLDVIDSEVLRNIYEVNVVAPLALRAGARRRSSRRRHDRERHLRRGGRGLRRLGWLRHRRRPRSSKPVGVLAAEHPDLRVLAVDPGDMRTEMHQDAFPGEDISDRPLPATVAPSLVALIDGERAQRPDPSVSRRLMNRRHGTLTTSPARRWRSRSIRRTRRTNRRKRAGRQRTGRRAVARLRTATPSNRTARSPICRPSLERGRRRSSSTRRPRSRPRSTAVARDGSPLRDSLLDGDCRAGCGWSRPAVRSAARPHRSPTTSRGRRHRPARAAASCTCSTASPTRAGCGSRHRHLPTRRARLSGCARATDSLSTRARNWPLAAYQTVFGDEPGSAEMPSASRPFTPGARGRPGERGVRSCRSCCTAACRHSKAHERAVSRALRVSRATAAHVNAVRRRPAAAWSRPAPRSCEHWPRSTRRSGIVHPAQWLDRVGGHARRAASASSTDLSPAGTSPKPSHLLMLEAIRRTPGAGRAAYARRARPRLPVARVRRQSPLLRGPG